MSEENDRLHVAICMDGNGRWAQARGLPRLRGHSAGAEAAVKTIEAAALSDVGTLTLFGFSTENWRRPPDEVAGLMNLLDAHLRSMRGKLLNNRIRLRWLGRRDRVPAHTRRTLESVETETARLARMTLCLAIDYGGRWELLQAAWKWAEARSHRRPPSEAEFAEALLEPTLPDVDLVIRTSGEQRLSNLLPWHTAYAELYFTPILWPDFGAREFREALSWYVSRSRRFGAVPVAQPV